MMICLQKAIKETAKLLEWVIRKKNYYLYRRLTGEQNALRMADDKSYIWHSLMNSWTSFSKRRDKTCWKD